MERVFFSVLVGDGFRNRRFTWYQSRCKELTEKDRTVIRGIQGSPWLRGLAVARFKEQLFECSREVSFGSLFHAHAESGATFGEEGGRKMLIRITGYCEHRGACRDGRIKSSAASMRYDDVG